MLIPVQCDCGKTFRVKEERIGRKGKCPFCGTVVTVPFPTYDGSSPGTDELGNDWPAIDLSLKEPARVEDDIKRPFWKDPVIQWGSVVPVLVLGWFSIYLWNHRPTRKVDDNPVVTINTVTAAHLGNVGNVPQAPPIVPVAPLINPAPPVAIDSASKVVVQNPQGDSPESAAKISQADGSKHETVSDIKDGGSAILFDYLLSEYGLIYMGKDIRAIEDMERFGNGKDVKAIDARLKDGRIAVTFSGNKVTVIEFIKPEDSPASRPRGLYRVKLVDGPYNSWTGLAEAMDLRPVPNLISLPPDMKWKDLEDADETKQVMWRGKATLYQDKQIFKEITSIMNSKLQGKEMEDAIIVICKRYNLDWTTFQKILAVGTQAKWPTE